MKTRRRATGALAFLLGWLLAASAARSGLPTLSVHHLDGTGAPFCCCGCDCSEHPDSAGSCLNPLNRDIVCGCEKEHRRDWEAPAPTLPDWVPPLPAPPLAPPVAIDLLAPAPPFLLPAGVRTILEAPH